MDNKLIPKALDITKDIKQSKKNYLLTDNNFDFIQDITWDFKSDVENDTRAVCILPPRKYLTSFTFLWINNHNTNCVNNIQFIQIK